MAGKKGKDTSSGSGRTLEDWALWDFVTRSIKPLHNRPSAPPTSPPAQAEKRPQSAQLSGQSFGQLSGQLPSQPPGQSTSLPASLTDRRTAEKLRRGRIRPEAVLDLHGLRQGEAQTHLTQFLLSAHTAKRRCVLIITGKGENNSAGNAGGGILRRMLPVWLGMAPLSPIILDHAPAQPKDGGSGAFYILLRRQR